MLKGHLLHVLLCCVKPPISSYGGSTMYVKIIIMVLGKLLVLIPEALPPDDVMMPVAFWPGQTHAYRQPILAAAPAPCCSMCLPISAAMVLEV